MTESPTEPVGPLSLPESGPTTLALVKANLKIGDTVDDELLKPIVAAVNTKVRGWPTSDKARGLTEWPADTVHGATMLAARLHKRQGSPDGVAAFGDMGAVYVQRNDPDVAMLLELGTHRKPAVG